MKIKYRKSYIALSEFNKLPRKTKKYFLGTRISKKKLKQLLESVIIHDTASTMYERPDIFPYMFCPKCGCREMIGMGDRAGYPEHWEEFRCPRCFNLVGYIDNSPFIHALQSKIPF